MDYAAQCRNFSLEGQASAMEQISIGKHQPCDSLAFCVVDLTLSDRSDNFFRAFTNDHSIKIIMYRAKHYTSFRPIYL